MPRYLRTNHKGSVAISVCDRCHMKVPHSSLVPDTDSPGLRVCPDCSDEQDPYRLPARKTEKVSLSAARPDVELTIDTSTIITTEYGEAIDFPPELSA